MGNCALLKINISIRKCIIIFFFSLCLLPFSLYSQKVYFCEAVDFLGNPEKAATEFTIPASGGFVKILVRLKKDVNCRNVVFDLYRLEKGKEILDNSIRMSVEPYLIWFYKEITFRKEGEFNVYVYDDKDQLLGIGKVKIFFR